MQLMQKILCCFLITEVSFSVVNGVDYYTTKPDYILTCRINDPDYSKCLTHSVQKLTDQLVIGIPEVTESFGPMDPMRYKDINFKQNGNEAATINANLTNVVVRGYSKAVIKQSKVLKKDYSWLTKILIPLMNLDANYKMKGRILLLPLQGNGKLSIEIENLDVTLHTKTHLYEKGGFIFDNVTSIRAELNMTRVRTHMSNLFNGQSKEIEDTTNQFFNDNWREFYEAIKPIIVETVENIFFDVMHKVFNLIPANFFLEDIATPEELYGKKNA